MDISVMIFCLLNLDVLSVSLYEKDLRNCRKITTTKKHVHVRFLGGCRWGDAESAAISHP
jgi:hypothetical protein